MNTICTVTKYILEVCTLWEPMPSFEANILKEKGKDNVRLIKLGF